MEYVEGFKTNPIIVLSWRSLDLLRRRSLPIWPSQTIDLRWTHTLIRNVFPKNVDSTFIRALINGYVLTPVWDREDTYEDRLSLIIGTVLIQEEHIIISKNRTDADGSMLNDLFNEAGVDWQRWNLLSKTASMGQNQFLKTSSLL